MRNKQGGIYLEFSIVLILLLSLTGGVVEMAWNYYLYIQNYNQLNKLVREITLDSSTFSFCNDISDTILEKTADLPITDVSMERINAKAAINEVDDRSFNYQIIKVEAAMQMKFLFLKPFLKNVKAPLVGSYLLERPCVE